MQKRSFFVLFLITFLLAVSPVIAQDDLMMHLRVAHFSPDAPAIDVYVNGEIAIKGLAYPEASEWVALLEDHYEIAVTPAGEGIESAIFGPSIFNLVRQTWITVAAVGSADNHTLAYSILFENYGVLPDDGARISVFHAIEGGPYIDVISNGNSLISGLAYPGTQGRNDGFFIRNIEAGTIDLEVAPTRNPLHPIIEAPNTMFSAGVNYLIAAVGTPDDPALTIIATDLDGEFMSMTIPDMTDEDMSDDTSDEDTSDETTAEAVDEDTADETSDESMDEDMSDETMDEDMSDETSDETVDETPTEDVPEASASALTIAEVVISAAQSAEPEFTMLLSAIASADPAIIAMVSDPNGDLTVFAPTDEAFASFLESIEMTLPDLLANPDLLSVILQYHVLDGALMAEEIAAMDGSSIPTMLGTADAIDISVTDRGVMLNDASTVLASDIPASNGVIHVVDAVLIPTAGVDTDMTEAMSEETAEEPADETTPDATEEPMDEDMSDEAMPEATDEAMDEDMSDEAMPEATDEAMDEDMSDEAMPEATDEPAPGGSDAGMGGSLAEATEEPTADASDATEATNTVADVVLASTEGEEPEFTILLAALQNADPSLLEMLSDPEQTLTVLAPTDEAFEALLETMEMDAETLLADTELLNQVLAYHILEDIINAETITLLSGEAIPTMLGTETTITLSLSEEDGILLNDLVHIVTPDIEADNGLIHVIDGVLLPAEG